MLFDVAKRKRNFNFCIFVKNVVRVELVRVSTLGNNDSYKLGAL